MVESTENLNMSSESFNCSQVTVLLLVFQENVKASSRSAPKLGPYPIEQIHLFSIVQTDQANFGPFRSGALCQVFVAILYIWQDLVALSYLVLLINSPSPPPIMKMNQLRRLANEGSPLGLSQLFKFTTELLFWPLKSTLMNRIGVFLFSSAQMLHGSAGTVTKSSSGIGLGTSLNRPVASQYWNTFFQFKYVHYASSIISFWCQTMSFWPLGTIILVSTRPTRTS